MNDSVRDPSNAIDKMREARDRPSVLKDALILLRGRSPSLPILAVEGREDSEVYAQWIRRISEDLRYEFLRCNGKDRVLALRDMVERDVNGIQRDVYFLVDRDFDYLKGRPASASTYVTDTYSVENAVVNGEAVTELVRVNFGCEADPDLRRQIQTVFDSVYSAFLGASKPVNFRIFCARKLSIEIPKGLDNVKCTDLIELAVEHIVEREVKSCDLIFLEREPTETECTELLNEFETLDAAMRYRGKYALEFLVRWLKLLAGERRTGTGRFFHGLAAPVNEACFSVESLASKVRVPESFESFIVEVAGPKQARRMLVEQQ